MQTYASIPLQAPHPAPFTVAAMGNGLMEGHPCNFSGRASPNIFTLHPLDLRAGLCVVLGRITDNTTQAHKYLVCHR